MNESEVKKYLKMAFWDLVFEPDDLYELLTKKTDKLGSLNLEKLYIRLMETYSWYRILRIVPSNQIYELFSDTVLSKLRSNHLRKRYEGLSTLLQKYPLSSAG